ncbi:MAG: GGDEF domain-containing protein, partial [Acidimicrobiia bacterium]|nr:GGDEF domain-containing protein [Acidimicrobiia bacterium]
MERGTPEKERLADRLQIIVASWSRWMIVAVAAFLLGLVVSIDLVTGSDLSFSVFYLIPVAFVAWYVGGGAATAFAVISAVLWFGADRWAGSTYSQPLIPVWNTMVRLGFFLVVATILSALRRAARLQEELAGRDALTGLANLRRFTEAAELEVSRAKRYGHAISVAYLDLDDFKAVNDRFGHQGGDSLLQAVASTIAGRVRLSDTVGRLGGDEFALLMPETSADAATVVVEKLREALSGAAST